MKFSPAHKINAPMITHIQFIFTIHFGLRFKKFFAILSKKYIGGTGSAKRAFKF